VRSAIVVAVPEAEPIVEHLRLRHTSDGPLGMPPHVTLLFPFVPAALVAEAEDALASLVHEQPAFDATFGRTARFPALLYLDPQPAEPFGSLTEAIAAAWPEYPPYEGAHEQVIPHLTVAESEDGALLDALAADVAPLLPLRVRVEAASVFVEDEAGSWHEHSRLPFSQSGVA
jgi:2'-5' RNA ligase